MLSALVLAGLGLGFGLHAAHAQPATLTLYSAQHPQVDAMLAAAFTKETGIKVLLHEGEGPDIASQIIQEGADSARGCVSDRELPRAEFAR